MNHKDSSTLVSVSRFQRCILRLLLPVFLLLSAGSAFAGGPYTFTLVSSNTTAVADNSTPDYLTFQVIDQSTGLPATSGVSLSFQMYTPSGASTILPVDGLGQITFSVTYGSIASIPIYVKYSGAQISGSPYTFNFVAGPPDPTTSYLSVDVPTSPPDGATADVVTAHIFDAYGNAISGAAVSFAISSSTVAGSPTYTPGLNGTSNASGTYTLDITSLYSGTINFTATVNGVPISTGSPAAVNFVATTPSTSNPATALYVDVPSSPADGASQDVVRAHIADVNGNPVPGATVVFTVSGGNVTGTAIYNPNTFTITTNAAGDAVLDIANTKAGTISYTATVNGSSINNGTVPAVVTFVAAAPSATNSTLTTIVSPQPPDGSAADVIEAHIVDANGNPVANTTVVFALATVPGSASGTAVVTTGLTITTDAFGNADIDITNTKAGTVNFTASVGGVPIGPSGSPTVATATFVATTPSPTQSTLTAIITPNQPDGTAQDAVQAHIVDANGNPVQNATVVFTLSGPIAGTAGTPSGLTFTTDVNGDAIVYITNTKSGDVTVTATVNGLTIMSGGSTATADVQFIATTPSTTASTLTTTVSPMPPDGTHADVVTAHIVDANGNPVPNVTVTFQPAGGSAQGTAQVPSLTVVTDANGDAILDITNTKSGTVNYQAYVGGVAIGPAGSPTTATVQFIATTPSAANSILVVDADNALDNGTATDNLHALIQDVNGNPVPNTTVTFTITGGTASGTVSPLGPTITVTTDANGLAPISFTNTAAGTVIVTASVGGTNLSSTGTNPNPATITFVTPPPVAANSTLTAFVSPNPPDGTSQDVVRAHIVDASGNPVAGVSVTFALPTPGGSAQAGATTSALTVITDASGNADLYITNTISGDVQVTAVIDGSPSTPIGPTGSPTVADVQFIATTPSTVNSVLFVIKDFQNADGVSKDKVQASIVDDFGNPVPNVAVTFTIMGGTAAGTVQPGGPTITIITDANGFATQTFTNLTAGTVIIQASVGGTPLLDNSPLFPNPATITFVPLAPSGTTSTLTATTTPTQANGTSADVVTAHIVDINGNPIAGVSVTFALPTPGGSAQATATTSALTVTTDANGDATLNIYNTKTGDVQVTATINGTTPIGAPTTADVVFTAGAPSAANSILVTDVASSPADNTTTDQVHAVIYDANNNLVPNTTVTFTITGGTATATANPLGPVITATTNALGVATFTVANSQPGTVIVTASVGGTDIASSGTNPNPATLTFTTPPPVAANSTLTAFTTPVPPDGTTPAVIRAHIVDASGNGVSGVAVTITLQPTGVYSTAVVASYTVTTDASGNADFDITNTLSGSVTATATINGSTPVGAPDQATVDFVATTPDISQSVLFVIKDFQNADGVSADKVEAVIVDQFGNPVPNIDVTFTIMGGTAAGTVQPGGPTITVKTNANGLADLPFTNLTAGTVIVQASISGTPLPNSGLFPNPATITFVPLAPSGPTSTLTATTPLMPADGVSADVVTAHIVDINGNPIAGVSVTFAVPTTGGSAQATATYGPLTVTTDVNGNATLNIYNTKTGDVQVTATINGTTPIGAPTTADVVFTAGAPSAANSYLVTDVATSPADNTTTDQVHAVIYDANNNLVPNTTVTFTITGGTATATANPLGPVITATTNALGVATFTVANSQPGTVIVTASVGGTDLSSSGANVNPATLNFTSPPSGPNSTITATVPTAPADGTTAAVVTAHIVDASGAIMANTSVTFTITGGTAAGTVSPAGPTITVLTNASGDAILDLTNLKTGTVIVTAAINGTIPVANGASATVTFTPLAASAAKSVVIKDVDNQPADNASLDQIHAVIYDANNNVVPNTTVTFTLSGGTAMSTANPSGPTITVTTDVNGIATFSVKNTQPGTVIVTASVGGTDIASSGANLNPVTLTFVSPSSSGGGTTVSTLVMDVTGSPADNSTPDVVHANIVDGSGTGLSGKTVVFSIAAGGTAGATAQLGTVTYLGNGNYSINITNTKPGTVILTATVDGQPILNGSNPATVTVDFVTGAPSATGGKTNLSIIVDNNVADGASTDSVQALITDVSGNPVANTTVTFTIEPGGTAGGTAAFAQTFTVTTNAQGIASIGITNTVAGTVNIGAYVGGVAITNSPALITFVNAPDITNPNTQLIVIVYEALADGQSATQVKAHIVDQAGNSIADRKIVFSIDSGSANMISANPVYTDNNGDAVINLTSKTPGYVLITATVDGKPIVFGSPARVHFAAINIYVPRVFTPNNDGTNDVLKPILVGMSQFHYFSVYNRWGNLIFTTQDPNAGWDGTFRGVPQPVETYLWIGEGIDVNGKKVVQRGMVSLVR